MKKAIAITASRPAGTLFSEAASLPLGASAAVQGAMLAKEFFMNDPATWLPGAGWLAGRLGIRAARTWWECFRVHVQ